MHIKAMFMSNETNASKQMEWFCICVCVCIFTADCSFVYCDWAPGENWKHDLLWR